MDLMTDTSSRYRSLAKVALVTFHLDNNNHLSTPKVTNSERCGSADDLACSILVDKTRAHTSRNQILAKQFSNIAKRDQDA